MLLCRVILLATSTEAFLCFKGASILKKRHIALAVIIGSISGIITYIVCSIIGVPSVVPAITSAAGASTIFASLQSGTGENCTHDINSAGV